MIGNRGFTQFWSRLWPQSRARLCVPCARSATIPKRSSDVISSRGAAFQWASDGEQEGQVTSPGPVFPSLPRNMKNLGYNLHPVIRGSRSARLKHTGNVRKQKSKDSGPNNKYAIYCGSYLRLPKGHPPLLSTQAAVAAWASKLPHPH